MPDVGNENFCSLAPVHFWNIRIIPSFLTSPQYVPDTSYIFLCLYMESAFYFQGVLASFHEEWCLEKPDIDAVFVYCWMYDIDYKASRK